MLYTCYDNPSKYWNTNQIIVTMHDGTYQIIVTMDHGWQSENGCLHGEDWENGWKDHTQKRLFWGFSPSFIKTKK